MENPENKPTRIFNKGKWLPTTKGLRRTDVERKKMKDAHIGRPISREAVIKESPIYEKIFPFLCRYLLVGDIVSIVAPDFTRKQVGNSIYNKTKSPKWHWPPKDYFSPEKVNDRMSKSRKGKPLKLADRQPLSEDVVNSIAFLHEFWKLGFFTKDISNWQKLSDLYKTNEKMLPESVFDRLRLEIFLTALAFIKSKGGHGLLENYKKLAGESNSPFAKKLFMEEQFIQKRIFPATGAEDWNRGGFGEYNKNRKSLLQPPIGGEKKIEKGSRNENCDITLRKIREVLDKQNGEGEKTKKED